MPMIIMNRDFCIQGGVCTDICYARDVFEMKEDGSQMIQPD
jgi:ferredoxin